MNNKRIDLKDNIYMISKEVDDFIKYYKIYYVNKYYDYLFNKSLETACENVRYYNSSYFIYKKEQLIGGVILKENLMMDLFLVPPFEDYEYLLDKLVEHLKEISDKDKQVTIRNVIEEKFQYYTDKGFIKYEVGYWMLRPTESLSCDLSYDYKSRNIVEDDVFEIADLIISSYKNNPHIQNVDKWDRYVEHAKSFFRLVENNDVLYRSSRVVVDIATNRIVGSILHMEFEEIPLITSFAVDPDHQGKGIGKHLLCNSISESSERYESTRLFVNENNSAIHLYENMGFVKNRMICDMILEPVK